MHVFRENFVSKSACLLPSFPILQPDGKMGPISTGQIRCPHLRKVAENLLQIDGSPIHKRALQDATSQATRSATRIQELLSRSNDLNNYIFHVVGFYLFIQTWLISVVAQCSTLRKGGLRRPLALSTVAAWSCCIPVWLNGMAIADLREDMYDEENIHKVAEKARSELRRLGSNYTFPADEEPTSKKRSTCYYFIPYALILLFLVTFALHPLF